MRVNNLANGKAFDFQVKLSRIGGSSRNLTSDAKAGLGTLVTNGTGVAVGLNADRVDSLNGNEIVAQAADAAVKAIQGAGSGGGGGGAGGGSACPANTTLAGGGCIENAPRPALSYADAAAACGSAGRRLVAPDVLLGARSLATVNLGGGEMSSDITAATLALTPGYATVSEAGALGVQALGTATAFRCITG